MDGDDDGRWVATVDREEAAIRPATSFVVADAANSDALPWSGPVALSNVRFAPMTRDAACRFRKGNREPADRQPIHTPPPPKNLLARGCRLLRLTTTGGEPN